MTEQEHRDQAAADVAQARELLAEQDRTRNVQRSTVLVGQAGALATLALWHQREAERSQP